MDAAVLIPWRAGCPHRETALAWVTARYEAIGLPVHLGVHDGPWCKALAVAAALMDTTAELLLIADADVWADPSDALAALDTHEWAIPHRFVHRLNPTATASLLSDEPHAGLEHPPYRGVAGGGMVAIRRDTYLRVPLDARFIGWGGEDHAWGMALHHLAGTPWRGTADLIHLWHPPQPDTAARRGPRAKVKVPDASNRALTERYRHAKPSQVRMQAVIDEAKEALWLSSS